MLTQKGLLSLIKPISPRIQMKRVRTFAICGPVSVAGITVAYPSLRIFEGRLTAGFADGGFADERSDLGRFRTLGRAQSLTVACCFYRCVR